MSLASYDIVCVAQPSWEGPYAKSTVLLMKELSKHHRVMYVDYASTYKDLIHSLVRGEFRKAFRMVGLMSRIRQEDAQLLILTLPPMLPLNFLPGGKIYRLLNRINGWIAAGSIRKAVNNLHLVRPVMVNAFAPGLGLGLLGRVNAIATIYYCYDEIAQAQWNSKHGGSLEVEYAKNVDGVIVSSDALRKEKAVMNRKTFVVKNGVDINLFQAKGRKNEQRENPMVGFVGSLDSRIDYQLLYHLISLSPEFKFRFIGRIVDTGFEIVRNLPNVEWIAPVAYPHVPDLIRLFDVGIIPFVKSDFTKNIYPLKINEYLAMGKPVVMTSFAHLPEFDGVVKIADQPFGFKKAIIDSIFSDNCDLSEARQQYAKGNSWKVKAEEFNTIIDSIVGEKE